MAKKLKCHTWLDVKGIRAAVREASIEPKHNMALEVEREAKTSMHGGRKKVTRAARGKRRARKVTIGEPSAPGTPPNVQSGIGRGSITTAFVKASQSYIVGPSSPPAPYMGGHEFGTRFHPPRPFMRPALMRALPRYPKLYKNLPLSRTKAGQRLKREQKAWMKKHGGSK